MVTIEGVDIPYDSQVFDTEHYVVLHGDVDTVLGQEPYTDGKFNYYKVYLVVNKQTEVVEHVCIQLPEACWVATGLNSAVAKAPWAWAGSIAEAAPIDSDKVN
jgi:hypothetical protein